MGKRRKIKIVNDRAKTSLYMDAALYEAAQRVMDEENWETDTAFYVEAIRQRVKGCRAANAPGGPGPELSGGLNPDEQKWVGKLLNVFRNGKQYAKDGVLGPIDLFDHPMHMESKPRALRKAK